MLEADDDGVAAVAVDELSDDDVAVAVDELSDEVDPLVVAAVAAAVLVEVTAVAAK